MSNCRFAHLCGVVFLVLWTVGSFLHAVPVEELQALEFKQYPGRMLPLETALLDEEGNAVRLGDYFVEKKPVLLVPGYFRCQMLCSGLSDGMLRALQGMRKSAGREFRVVYFSIDPQEEPAKAQERKRIWTRRYARLGAENGCAFLRGGEREISMLAAQIGFEYQYDPVSKEFAHPAGFLVVTPKGRIHRYFFGVSFSAADLEKAIDDATVERTGSIIKEFLLLCFHYNPVRSRYGESVMLLIRLLALGTMAGLGIAMVRSSRKRREERR
jgi:protein SCO1/2